MTPKQQAQADEQDRLMDEIKMEDFEPEPNHYQDELTKAKELLGEATSNLYEAADVAAMEGHEGTQKPWLNCADRIERFLEEVGE
jgi:hypothetical protein